MSRLPTPGYEKTVSATIEPVRNNVTTTSAVKVRTGIAALRRRRAGGSGGGRRADPHCGRPALQHLRQRGLARDDRRAEVAPHELAEVDHVLLPDGLVQAIPRAQLGLELSSHMLAPEQGD